MGNEAGRGMADCWRITMKPTCLSSQSRAHAIPRKRQERCLMLPCLLRVSWMTKVLHPFLVPPVIHSFRLALAAGKAVGFHQIDLGGDQQLVPEFMGNGLTESI